MRLNHGIMLLVIALPGFSAPALAHAPVAGAGQEQAAALVSAGVLGVFWMLYLVGSWRVRPAAWQAAGFHLTMLMCVFSVLGPLDEWAARSTSAHMTQHMMFMVVVAPLWVLSRPLPQVAAAGGRAGAVIWEPLLRLAQYPMRMAYVHGVVIWLWHTPYFYLLALEHPWWHVTEHALFLGTAGLFWWAVLRSSQRNVQWALFALLLTLMHTGFLGAILTFAQTPLYGESRSLEDQQLAGLIMWVLGAFPYLLASAWVSHRWYRRVQRQPS
jgi:putative membrane protein